MRIGLISDTHGLIPDDVLNHLHDCDQVWHAGDIGIIETLDQLDPAKTEHWVWGNIDDQVIRRSTKEYDVFEMSGVKVLIIHIGGYPGRYSKVARQLIQEHRPDLFISGHSHILKVMQDQRQRLLHFNPGACGYKGFHKVRTLLKFQIEDEKIFDLNVIELANRHAPR